MGTHLKEEKMPKLRITITLEASVYNELETLATIENRSISNMIETIIMEGLALKASQKGQEQ